MHLGKKIAAIITAAGVGSRMVGYENKLWINIEGKTVLYRTVEKILSANIIDELVLVVNEDTKKLVEKYIMPHITIPVCLVMGGEERQDSMANGLKKISADVDWVLCHDGARPFVTKQIILDALTALKEYCAAVPGVPCKDTIKVAWDNMEVQATPNRKYLYQIQTPQVFHRKVLMRAYEIARQEGIRVTDDASLVEKIGLRVKIVPGTYENIKITTPEDVGLGRLIAKEEDYENWNGI